MHTLMGLVLLISSSLMLWFSPAFAEEMETAVLTKIVNRVEVKKAKMVQWQEPMKGERLENKDEVRTLRESKAEVQFSDLSITRLAPMTNLVIDIQNRSVSLNIGKILMKIFRGGKSIRVITPAAVAATVSWKEMPPVVASLSLEGIRLAEAKGDVGSEFVVSVDENKKTDIVVIHGNVVVSNNTFQYSVGLGQSISIEPDGRTAGPQDIDLDKFMLIEGNQDLLAEINGDSQAIAEPKLKSGFIYSTQAKAADLSLSNTAVPSPVEPPPVSLSVPVNVIIR